MCMWPFIYSVQGAEVKIQLPIVYQLEFNYCALRSCVFQYMDLVLIYSRYVCYKEQAELECVNLSRVENCY